MFEPENWTCSLLFNKGLNNNSVAVSASMNTKPISNQDNVPLNQGIFATRERPLWSKDPRRMADTYVLDSICEWIEWIPYPRILHRHVSR